MLLLVSVLQAGACFAGERFQRVGPVKLDRDGKRWAEKTLKKLSLEEKVGQVLMVRGLMEFVNLQTSSYTQLRDVIRKYHIGSVLLTVRVEGGFLVRSQPYEAAMLTNLLQRDSKLPLIFAADFERGLYMRLNGVTIFPHAMAFGAAGKTSYAEAMGRIVGRESRAIGVQWNFFPVVDVNSNPANPIINTRSFGEDPEMVAALGAAYIEGSRQAGLLATAKHFPGHGDTATDSHLELARVSGDLARVESVELPPFRRAIEAGVDSVMVAHVTIPALEPDPNRVATNSARVVTGWLKDKMGFKGLVVTDAMEMRGLTRLYPPGAQASGRAAVDAFKAGNDMILLPSDLEGAYNGLLRAVRDGEIPKAQLNASVLKVLRAKASVGLNRARMVDINGLSSAILNPANVLEAQEIADAAVTLVRDNGKVLPLKKGTSAQPKPYEVAGESQDQPLALIFTDDVRSEIGRGFERGLHSRLPEANLVLLDNSNSAGMTDAVMALVKNAPAVVVAAYVTPLAGGIRQVKGVMTNSVSLADSMAALMDKVLGAAKEKTVFVAMGSPYLAVNFPDVANYLCTFSSGPTSETSALKALFGEMPVRGHLPVTLPGVAARGFGIERPAAAAVIQLDAAKGPQKAPLQPGYSANTESRPQR